MLADARMGSLTDMEGLADRAESLPLTVRESAIDVFFSALRSPPTSSESTASPSKESKVRALISILCIANAHAGKVIQQHANSSSHRRSTTNLRAMVMRDWPSVRQWLRYFARDIDGACDILDTGDTSFEQRKQTVIVAICALLRSLGEDEVLEDMIYCDAQLLLIVQYLWLQQGLDADDTPMDYVKWQPSIVARVYAELLLRVDKQEKDELMEKVALDDTFRSALAESALNRVRIASKRLKSVYSLVDLNTAASVAQGVATSNEQLAEASWNYDGIVVIIKALRTYLEFVQAHPEETMLGLANESRMLDTLTNLGTFLASIFITQRSDMQLRNALKHGLLGVLGGLTLVVSKGRRSHNGPLADTYETLLMQYDSYLRGTTQYTMFRSVVLKIAVNVEEMDRSGQLDQLVALDRGIGKRWSILKQLTLERTICKVIASRASKNRMIPCRGVSSTNPHSFRASSKG